MLHGNVSRKGYGNALIGRYGGCFEEGYNEAYDDRAYRAKDLDAPAKYAPTLEVRKGNARYRRGLKNMARWKCQISNTHISPKNSCTYYR